MGLVDSVLQALGLALIRLFYREIAVTGRAPAEGPVVLVANHPNGLLDPLVLRVAIGRPVAFLAKSTLFTNPIGRRVMEAFSAIPVYRAKEADTAKNEATFTRCRALLGDGGWLALFPEGVSHDAPGLQPLKTGAARIALQSTRPVRVVPVGILYEDKEIFRSRVALAFGDPIEVTPTGEDEPPADAARALTARIAEELGEVVLQAADREIWRGLVAVAAWTSPDGGRDMAALDRRARALAAGARALNEADPERLEELVERTRRFVRVLEAVGVTDPLRLEAPPISPVRALLPLVLLAPLALVGAVLGWVPYRLVRPLAIRLSGGHADIVSTLKLLLGLVVIGGAWIAEALVLGWAAGPEVGAAILALGPLSGFVALRWGERLDLRREALRAGSLVSRRPTLAEAVAERRKELATEVEEALRVVETTGTSSSGASAEPGSTR